MGKRLFKLLSDKNVAGEDYKELRKHTVTTRRWQELEPRRVQAVKAFVGWAGDEAELSLEPGDIVTEVQPADWLEDSQFHHSRWLEGTLKGRVGLVLESYVRPAL